MNKANQQQEALFDAARKLTDPAQRRAFLDAACAGDPELRRRVEVLLAAGTEADKFFAEGGAALSAASEPAEAPTQGGMDGGTVRVTLPPEEQPGTRIGHYKLREKIGEGGCGLVYVAEQEEPVRRRVALKVIKPGMDTRQVMARFEAERQALAMMDHPNIAKVLDAGTTENGRAYFIMELVRGIRITDYCGPESPGHESTVGIVHPGLQRRPTRPSGGHHSSRPQAVEYPRHFARRRARPEGDRFWHRQGDRRPSDRSDRLHRAAPVHRYARLHESGTGGDDRTGHRYIVVSVNIDGLFHLWRAPSLAEIEATEQARR